MKRLDKYMLVWIGGTILAMVAGVLFRNWLIEQGNERTSRAAAACSPTPWAPQPIALPGYQCTCTCTHTKEKTNEN